MVPGNNPFLETSCPEKKRYADTNKEIYRFLRLVMLAGTTASFALILAGFFHFLLQRDLIATVSARPAIPIGQIMDQLLQFQTEAFLSLGILILLAIPVGFVAVSLIVFWRQGEWFSSITAGIVLAVLLASASASLW